MTPKPPPPAGQHADPSSASAAPLTLEAEWRDRAAGVLLGQACGDALGVHYELGSAPLPQPPQQAQMLGGGLGHYAPGQWSDDTEMAIAIAQVSCQGADLRSPSALDAIAAGFLAWFATDPADVGAQTRAVLGPVLSRRRDDLGRDHGGMHEHLRAQALALHAATGRTAGNGALMRTAVVGLTRLRDRRATAAAARAVAELTHPDPLAGDAGVLWSEAVRVAVSRGRLDVEAGLELLPEQRRAQWSGWLAQARGQAPDAFCPNGFTVPALQAALAAVHAAVPAAGIPLGGAERAAILRTGLQAAISAGHDTDTVAAIAGGLLGGLLGASAVPAEWDSLVHGWPGLRAPDLRRLASQTAQAGALGAAADGGSAWA